MSVLKRVLYPLLIVVLVATAVMAAPQFVASKNKGAFHTATCTWVKKIAPNNVVYFETRDAAIAAGHKPCKVCKP